MKVNFNGNTVTAVMTRNEYIKYIVSPGKAESKQKVPGTTESLASHVTTLLNQIGIPHNIKGFGYLREAITLSVNDHAYISNITTRLYPEIANTFDTTPNRVERAIRHAIEVAWCKGSIGAIEKLFGYCFGKNKPNNSQFIALLSDALRLSRGDAVERE